MGTGKKTKIDLGGKSFLISGDVSADYLHKLAQYINGKIEALGEANYKKDFAQSIVLVALNIVDEFFQIKQIKTGKDQIFDEKIDQLISMLEKGIIGEISLEEEK